MPVLDEQDDELRHIISTFNIHPQMDDRRKFRRTGVVSFKGTTCWMEDRDESRVLLRLPDESTILVEVSEVQF